MSTMRKKFVPLIKLSSLWLLENVKFLQGAQPTDSSDRVVRRGPANDTPADIIRNVLVDQIVPDVGAECGLVVFLPDPERTPVLQDPGLQINRTTSVSFSFTSVMSGDSGPVHNIPGVAPAW